MAKAPAFQFYPSDFLTDTQSWEIEEVGIYIRLLSSQWLNKGLPNDMKRLARIAGCDFSLFEKAWVILGFKFFVNNEGFYVNAKLEEIRGQQDEYLEKQRLNGSKGGRPVKTETQTKPINNPTVNPNHNPKITSSTSTSINIEYGDFWDLYDKKVGEKAKVEKKWNSLTDAEREAIMVYVPKYKTAEPDKGFRKHPETFLNNRSWEDEIIVKGLVATKPAYTATPVIKIDHANRP